MLIRITLSSTIIISSVFFFYLSKLDNSGAQLFSILNGSEHYFIFREDLYEAKKN